MAARKLNILMLIDVLEALPVDYDFSYELKDADWKGEKEVYTTLKSLGHQVKIFGLYNDIKPLLEYLDQNKVDLIFSLCETFSGNRKLEPNVVALIELLGVKFTGNDSAALALCKDKALTKKILSYHKIKIPKFVVSRKKMPVKKLKKFPFPAFIKPLGLEASEGISQLSFASNEKDCFERVKYIHEKLGVDAIIEEFIEGRELYVGVMGNNQLKVFPPRELRFKQMPEDGYQFATFKAKWDQEYRKKWGIDTYKADPIEDKTLKKMLNTCKKIYRLFQMNGYGRIDLRLKENGDFVFLEANPNPALGKNEDFSLSAKYAGLSYEEVLKKIISLSGV